MKRTKWIALLSIMLALVIAMPSAVMADDFEWRTPIFYIYQANEDCCKISVSLNINGETITETFDRFENGCFSQKGNSVSASSDSSFKNDNDSITEGTITVTPKEGYKGKLIAKVRTWQQGIRRYFDGVESGNDIIFSISDCRQFEVIVFPTMASEQDKEKTGSVSVSAVEGCTFKVDKETLSVGDTLTIAYNVDDRFQPQEHYGDDDYYDLDLELNGCEYLSGSAPMPGDISETEFYPYSMELLITDDPQRANVSISFVNPNKNLGIRAPKKTGETFNYDDIQYVVTSDKTGTQTVKCIGRNKTSDDFLRVPHYAEDENGVKYWVTEIEKDAFKNEKIIGLRLDQKVKKIGSNAFRNCSTLERVYIESTSLKSSSVGKNAFKGIKKNCKFYVREECVKKYSKWLRKKGQSKIKVKSMGW